MEGNITSLWLILNDVSTYLFVIKCINKILIDSNGETFEILHK